MRAIYLLLPAREREEREGGLAVVRGDIRRCLPAWEVRLLRYYGFACCSHYHVISAVDCFCTFVGGVRVSASASA